MVRKIKRELFCNGGSKSGNGKAVENIKKLGRKGGLGSEPDVGIHLGGVGLFKGREGEDKPLWKLLAPLTRER